MKALIILLILIMGCTQTPWSADIKLGISSDPPPTIHGYMDINSTITITKTYIIIPNVEDFKRGRDEL